MPRGCGVRARAGADPGGRSRGHSPLSAPLPPPPLLIGWGCEWGSCLDITICPLQGATRSFSVRFVELVRNQTGVAIHCEKKRTRSTQHFCSTIVPRESVLEGVRNKLCLYLSLTVTTENMDTLSTTGCPQVREKSGNLNFVREIRENDMKMLKSLGNLKLTNVLVRSQGKLVVWLAKSQAKSTLNFLRPPCRT